ncbi:MAG TPA: MCE family protein [Acidimicrobiales bacterium]|jgi:phospholipid/cholesterol/gamma-HCH transport system substrate-binding protein
MSDASTRSSARRHAALGLALLLVILAGVYFILGAFTGHFSSYDVVYADVPASGTGISNGSVVIFRDVTVGEVGSLGRELPDGLLKVTLHITPDDLSSIPQGVKADVEIATIFGTQGINLEPPATSSGHLEAGQTVPSVAVSKTTTLQGDATDLDNLLNALHPAALDETLTAIATALRDQGPQLGTTIDKVATYLNEMLPQLPNIVRDFNELGPVTQDLSQAVPNIISTLGSGSTVATTITNNASQLHQLLANGTPTANDLTSLLSATQGAFEDLVANAGQLLGDIGSNPNFVAQTLQGFDSWSKAYAAAESQGPFLTFAGSLTVDGSAQALLAALGVPGSSQLIEQGLGVSNFNPATYTAADCPRYTGQAGPNCPANTASTGTTNTSNAAQQNQTTMITPVQEAAAVKIASGLDKGKAPPSSAVATFLLEPLLLELSKAGS